MSYNPLLIVGGCVGLFAAIFIIAYALIKDKKNAIGFDRKMKDGELIKRLLKYAKPYFWRFVIVFLIMLITISYQIVSPILVGEIEETVKGEFEMSTVIFYVVCYAVILVLSLVAMYLEAIMLQKTGQRIVSTIREDVFTHIESLSHAQLNEIPIGKLVTRVTNDTDALSMMFTNIIVDLIKNCFVIVGVLIAMLLINYELTLMVLCFVPFIVIFTVIFRKFSRKAYRKVKDGYTDINTFLSENLSGMKITQIFNRGKFKSDDFAMRNSKLQKALMGEIFVFGIFRPVVNMLYMFSILCLFYLGGKGYLDGSVILGQEITAGTIVTFYMYISRFFDPIQNLAEQFNRLQSAFASAEKIFTVMDIVPSVQDDKDAIELETVKGEIEFRNVWFQYVPDRWVLKDVSFKINAGDTVAFVGATGSGKTTILSLLCRNYDIQKGQILLDGIDIKKIKIQSLRRHFGQMLQDVFLFSGTIKSNIVLREDKFTDEEIIKSCEYVNADKFINKLPKKLDEEVRERGNNFSAGQRQLLSFARTVIHRPEVMILDEATANIDTETEVLIQDSLEKMMNIGTMLIVAHRLSTVQKADKIIVIEKGVILEQGTHDELIKMRGKYYGLYKLQYDKSLLENK